MEKKEKKAHFEELKKNKKWKQLSAEGGFEYIRWKNWYRYTTNPKRVVHIAKKTGYISKIPFYWRWFGRWFARA